MTPGAPGGGEEAPTRFIISLKKNNNRENRERQREKEKKMQQRPGGCDGCLRAAFWDFSAGVTDDSPEAAGVSPRRR